MVIGLNQILCRTFFGVLAVSSAIVAGAAPASAQAHCSGPQIGTWKLHSVVSVDVKTGQKSQDYGAHPSGFISYGSDCRMSVIILADARKAPAGVLPTDAERISLYKDLRLTPARTALKATSLLITLRRRGTRLGTARRKHAGSKLMARVWTSKHWAR